MAKKIKAPTYAERARKILKKYPRADWDAIERNDMLKELRQLKIEQEATRPLMEIADKANEMDAGAISPSKTDQSFGPTNPQEGDPRFQRWAQEVPGMGGYDIDPTQMNSLGPQMGADPRKMSMQQYQADTQFAIGGGFTRRPNNSFLNATPGVSDPRYNLWKENVPTFAGSYDYNNSLSDPNIFGDLMPQGRSLVGSYGSNNQSATGLAQMPSGGIKRDTSLDLMNQVKGLAPLAQGIQTQERYNPMTAVGGQAPNMAETLKDVPLAPLEGALDAGPGLGTAAAVGGNKYQVPKTSMAPFLLSAASSVIGDIAQMRNLRKMPQNVDLGRMTASKVNYEPERQLMTRQANQMANVNAANARNLGMNAANAYANTSAANAGLYDQYGSGIGQSYMREQNTNAQLAQQANQTNTGLRAQEAMQNMQLKQQQVAGRGQGISSLASTIPQMTQDYGQQVNQDRIISMMGDDMGMYQQILENPTFLQKLAKAFNVDPRFIIARMNTGIQGNQPT